MVRGRLSILGDSILVVSFFLNPGSGMMKGAAPTRLAQLFQSVRSSSLMAW